MSVVYTCMYDGQRFNSISHLVGATLALAGSVVLVTFAAMDGDTRKILSYSVYGLTLFLFYLFSTLYHGLAVVCLALRASRRAIASRFSNIRHA